MFLDILGLIRKTGGGSREREFLCDLERREVLFCFTWKERFQKEKKRWREGKKACLKLNQTRVKSLAHITRNL